MTGREEDLAKALAAYDAARTKLLAEESAGRRVRSARKKKFAALGCALTVIFMGALTDGYIKDVRANSSKTGWIWVEFVSAMAELRGVLPERRAEAVYKAATLGQLALAGVDAFEKPIGQA